MDEIYHHGVLGMKWGVRRYQNPDGTLTEAGKKRLERIDSKWAQRHEERIYKKTYRRSKREVEKYRRKVLDKQYSAAGRTYMNAYNKKLAEVMNTNIGDIAAPSGRVVRYVAKRGEYGVYMALADSGYDMSNVKNGVWSNGRIGYKNASVKTG